jgi:hypothetical protein
MSRARDFAVSLGDHRMTFDASFLRSWRGMYSELSSERRHVMAARSEAYCKRLATIYALLDGTAVVSIEHLDAAVAVFDYVTSTIEYVFGSATPDRNEAKILDALKAAPDGLTRTEISVGVFKRHLKSKVLGALLGRLLTNGFIHRSIDAGSSIRPVERWTVKPATSADLLP